MNSLSPEVKGALAIIAGVVLILDALNITVFSFNLIIVIGGFALIAWGIMKLDGFNRVKKLIKKS